LNNEMRQLKKVITPKEAAKKSYFKKAFFKGLAGILPALLTIVILVWCYQILRDYLGVHVNSAIEWLVGIIGLEPAAVKINMFIATTISVHLAPADPASSELRLRPIIGIVLSLILIYILGSFISSYIGKKFFPKLEKMFLRVPIVKAVYPYARQVTDFFLGDQTIKFERIVAIEYPRKGVYSVGFVTNEGLRDVRDKVGKRMLTVFMPASPTPVTGYPVMVPADEVIPLNISIDDALRFVITGGVVLPLEEVGMSEPAALKGELTSLDAGPSGSGTQEQN